MAIMRKISLLIMLTYVAACGGGGGDNVTQNAQILQTTTQSTDTDTSSQSAYSTTSSIGEAGQIYVLERLSLGPEKRLSAWARETYDAQISLDHVLIDANGTIYGNPTPNPAAILQFTAKRRWVFWFMVMMHISLKVGIWDGATRFRGSDACGSADFCSNACFQLMGPHIGRYLWPKWRKRRGTLGCKQSKHG